MQRPKLSFRISIEKLVFGGQGLAHAANRTAFIWNALPGEEVTFFVTKKRKGCFEGIAEEIHRASPHRTEPKEDHFLSCSPWQILTHEEELKWKQTLARETYEHLGGFSAPDLIIADDAARSHGYRNKMEFSFAVDGSLALYERGSHRLRPLKSCVLAEPIVNEVAEMVVEWAREEHIPPNILKSLIVRSDGNSHAIAALFLTDCISVLKPLPLSDSFRGFHVYFSDPVRSVGVPTKKLLSSGQDFLIAEIGTMKFKFGIFSFFQVNIPLFTQMLNDMVLLLDAKKSLVDYYAGVGTIGLTVAPYIKEGILVESNEEAAACATENIELNGCSPRVRAIAAPAEKTRELITKDSFIIFDPPRVGLHPKIIQHLIEVKPERIFYLSCNIATQARDLKLLSSVYTVSFLKLYNFFPRTPHIEALCVLDRK